MGAVSSHQQLLREYLSFYQDLGITELYRRRLPDQAALPSDPTDVAQAGADAAPPIAAPPAPLLLEVPLPSTPSLFAPAPVADDSLARIRADIGDCIRCRLCEGRNKIVFGSGPDNARLLFVGEGPGADEDATGEPFVGRAGQLLTQMIDNTAEKDNMPLRRADCYIANVVKCRPPENRKPQPDEAATCGQFLERQIAVIKPKAIVALGGSAVEYLLKNKTSMTQLRGRWLSYQGIPLLPTWHPSFLLRSYKPEAKRESWQDLRRAFAFVTSDRDTPE